MNVLDLFSGIGGFSLGLERAGMRTIAFCEIDPFCRKVLRKHWPDVPIYEDIRELTGERLRADGIVPDLICGGYPCQPFSHAGKRRGEEDDRSLWPEMFRIIEELGPDIVLGENVVGHISMGLDEVLSDLEGAGYASQTFVIPACGVDAPHQRARVWIVAHDYRTRQPQSEGCKQEQRGWTVNGSETLADAKSQPRRARNGQVGKHGSQSNNGSEIVANTGSGGQQGQGPRWYARNSAQANERQTIKPFNGGERSIWRPEPTVGRVAHGVPARVDRLRSLGNAVVPQVVEMIGRAIMEAGV